MPEDAAGPETAAPDGQLYRLAWAFYLLLGVAGVLWIGAREGTIPVELFFAVSTLPRDIAVGVGAAAALLVIWFLADRYLPLARALEERLQSVIGRLEPGEALGMAVLSGFAEEFFFRGAVQGSWGVVIATILFAALHSGREKAMWLWTAFAAVSGALFGLMTLWTGNLLAAVIAHTVFNGVNLYQMSARQRREV